MSWSDLERQLTQWLSAPRLDDEPLEARRQALKLAEDIVRFATAHPNMPETQALASKARRLKARLEAANASLYAQVCRRIRAFPPGSAAIREALTPFSHYGGQRGTLHLGYDGLDDLLDGMLGLDEAPPPHDPPTPEMVHLEPTPASVVLELVDHLPLTRRDTLVDLGAGLGKMLILAHLLTGARGIGIEIEPAYCALARGAARRMGIHLTMIEGDARTAPLDEGDVYYMFTPFTGHVLEAVLTRLYKEARMRPILIASYGTTTLALAQESWLCPLDSHCGHTHKLGLFEAHA